LNTVSITLEKFLFFLGTFSSPTTIDSEAQLQAFVIADFFPLIVQPSILQRTTDEIVCSNVLLRFIRSLILFFSPSRIIISDLQRETWGLRRSGDSCRKQLLLQL